jgi:hypothetical protein
MSVEVVPGGQRRIDRVLDRASPRGSANSACLTDDSPGTFSAVPQVQVLSRAGEAIPAGARVFSVADAFTTIVPDLPGLHASLHTGGCGQPDARLALVRYAPPLGAEPRTGSVQGARVRAPASGSRRP